MPEAVIGNYLVQTCLHEGRYEAVSIRCKDTWNNSTCERTRNANIGAHTPFNQLDNNNSCTPGSRVVLVSSAAFVHWCGSVVRGLTFEEVCGIVKKGELSLLFLEAK